MKKTAIRHWKKVYLGDLSYIAFEMKEAMEKPALVLLNGEMGAGKTTFVKQFMADTKATSPSYSIVNESGEMLFADFFRLNDKSEIPALELSLYLEGKNYFLVEWGEKYFYSLLKEIPEDFHYYSIQIDIHPPSEDHPESRDFTLFVVKPE